jgi:hypothetical protein
MLNDYLSGSDPRKLQLRYESSPRSVRWRCSPTRRHIRFEAQGRRQSAAFEYDTDWLSSPEAFPLEPNLPLVRGMQFHKRVGEGSPFHGVIADTEPDGWARRVILRDHAKTRQEMRASGLTPPQAELLPVDFLLAVDEMSRVGALRFRDEHGIFQRAWEDGRRGVPPLVELAHLVASSRAVETNTETAADLAYLRGRGTSLGGLRPKCSVMDDDGTLALLALAVLSGSASSVEFGIDSLQCGEIETGCERLRNEFANDLLDHSRMRNQPVVQRIRLGHERNMG